MLDVTPNYQIQLPLLIRRSSAVEHSAVNRRATGSNPVAGAMKRHPIVGVFLWLRMIVF